MTGVLLDVCRFSFSSFIILYQFDELQEYENATTAVTHRINKFLSQTNEVLWCLMDEVVLIHLTKTMMKYLHHVHRLNEHQIKDGRQH